MEIEIFDSAKIRSRKVIFPAVSFFKSGVIVFNDEAVESMNLQEKMTISFARDRKQPRDWYIVHDAKGIQMLRNSQKKMQCSAKIVRDLILEAIPVKPKTSTMRFRVATQTTQLGDKVGYAILTSNLI